MDKVMAGFIIATTAAAMGMRTTMFFTFWGLTALRKSTSKTCPRNWMQTMLGWMLPKNAASLPLSQLNMAGMGAGMLKRIMAEKKFASLPELIEAARDLDVRMIACQMSMDAMGFSKEQLLEGLEIAGAATYVGEAQGADLNLLIS
jgi:peroxiredoxin family protein